MHSKLVDIPTFFRGRWVVGVGSLLGVGSRGRVAPGSAWENGVGSLPGRRFRAALAGPPPLDVAAAPHVAAAAPKTEPTR